MARIYCKNCDQSFDNMAAVESHRSFQNAEMGKFCDYQDDALEHVGLITHPMEVELRNRWKYSTPREKWDRIYSILFPDEAIPVPCKFTGTVA